MFSWILILPKLLYFQLFQLSNAMKNSKMYGKLNWHSQNFVTLSNFAIVALTRKLICLPIESSWILEIVYPLSTDIFFWEAENCKIWQKYLAAVL